MRCVTLVYQLLIYLIIALLYMLRRIGIVQILNRVMLMGWSFRKFRSLILVMQKLFIRLYLRNFQLMEYQKFVLRIKL